MPQPHPARSFVRPLFLMLASYVFYFVGTFDAAKEQEVPLGPLRRCEAMKDLFDLSGKTAIITGSGDGLGRAFAQAMAEAGANVVCTGRRIENTSKTETMIKKFGVKTLAMQVDVSE